LEAQADVRRERDVDVVDRQRKVEEEEVTVELRNSMMNA
jgi:hypothetical protein